VVFPDPPAAAIKGRRGRFGDVALSRFSREFFPFDARMGGFATIARRGILSGRG